MDNYGVWLDCLYTKTFKNGYVLNIHKWKNEKIDKNFYDVRLGWLNAPNVTPVLILLKTDTYKTAKDFCIGFLKKITDNAGDILFDNQLD